MDLSANEDLIPTEITEVYPGLYQEWTPDHAIVVYRPSTISKGVLDAWSELVIATMNTWAVERPYLALHDISTPGVSTLFASMTRYDMMNIGITPEGKIRAESLLNERLGLVARVAIAFNITLSGHIGKTLLNHYTDKHPAVQYKSYYSREKSVRWLLTHVNPSGQHTASV